MILQDNCYETYNTDLVDICFGVGAVTNLGSVIKYDRLSKIYRAIEIVKEREEHEWMMKKILFFLSDQFDWFKLKFYFPI